MNAVLTIRLANVTSLEDAFVGWELVSNVLDKVVSEIPSCTSAYCTSIHLEEPS